jgi:hypothetical protein
MKRDALTIERKGDSVYETAITFATEAEAQAFMRGFCLGHHKLIAADIDREEPSCILLDINGDEAYGYYIEQLENYLKGMSKIEPREKG